MSYFVAIPKFMNLQFINLQFINLQSFNLTNYNHHLDFLFICPLDLALDLAELDWNSSAG